MLKIKSLIVDIFYLFRTGKTRSHINEIKYFRRNFKHKEDSVKNLLELLYPLCKSKEITGFNLQKCYSEVKEFWKTNPEAIKYYFPMSLISRREFKLYHRDIHQKFYFLIATGYKLEDLENLEGLVV